MNLPIDGDAFDRASRMLLDRFRKRVRLDVPDHGYPRNWGAFSRPSIDYVVWSEVFTCPHCGGEIVFYDVGLRPGHRSRATMSSAVPSCGAALGKRTLERRLIRERTLAGDIVERVEFRPVRIAWRRDRGERDKSNSTRSDRSVLDRVRRLRVIGFPVRRSAVG